MSIETKADADLLELERNRRTLRYGLCPFSQRCDLYFPHDYHCNQNRSLFLVNGSTIPNCYKEKTE